MTRKWLIALALLAGLVVMMVAAAFFYVRWLGDKPGANSESVLFYVAPGMSVSQAADRASEEGLVVEAWHFKLVARLKGAERRFFAGEYEIAPAQSLNEIFAQIARQQRYQRMLVVPEGFSVLQVETLLEGAFGLDMTGYERPAEGSLLPETYFYERGDSARALIARMQTAMDRALEQAWQRRADVPVSSKSELLVLASIIEKETGLAAERPLVAAVFTNRLRLGMRLQTDPTVIYGLTGGVPLGRSLTRADLNSDTPFNSYRIKGLPPTPIANPGIQALYAAADPADVPYLYFVVDGSGGHAFAETLDEHNRNVAQWRQIEKNRLKTAETDK